MSLTQLSISAALTLLAFAAGCTKTDDEVLYCNPDDQSSRQRQGAMHIDIERQLVYGDDTSSAIYPLVTGHFAGFEGPFPLLLFSDSVDPGEIQGDVVVGNTVFGVSSVEGSFGDLWLITAKPREGRSGHEAHQRSAVLYSIADGVLSIGLSAFIGQEDYPVNYVPCGNRTLRYDDLRSFSGANR